MVTPTAPPPPQTPSDALAWESANRRNAALAAWAAAALTLAGAILTALAFGSLPKADATVVSITDALGHLAAGTPIPPGRAVEQLRYIGDHGLRFAIGPVLTGLGGFALYGVLAFLYRATRARSAQMSQAAIVAAAIGAVAYGVGSLVVGVFRVLEATGLPADATNSDAVDALSGGPLLVGTFAHFLGGFALGFAFVLIGLGAMRAGLLTRFMGVLGIIVGATFVLPLDQQGIIRSFWLVAVGALIVGRWPNGVPPAWLSGRAEPWPSARDLQQQRRPRGEASRELPRTPAPAPPPDDSLSQGRRRKRRKRR